MALDDDWMLQGKCRELGPERADVLFFPKKKRGVKTDYSEAKAICHTCPVRTSCLAYAIAHGIAEGVWGAKDPNERKRMRKELKVLYRKVWWRDHPLSRSTKVERG
jgi:WhiB family redox-sensing transcriptional regulator